MQSGAKQEGNEKLPCWNKKEYFHELSMLLVKKILRGIQRLLFFIPIKNNRIIVYSLKKRGYGCNLKYFTEYIFNNCKDAEILWITGDICSQQMLSDRGIPVAGLHSLKHFCFRHRAGIVMTDDFFYYACIHRKKQIFVNTWHGGINYKKIGYAGISFANRLQRFKFMLENPQPDIFVAGSYSFMVSTAKAFGFCKDCFLLSGLPRNDVLVKPGKLIAERVRKSLGCGMDDRLLLYAPTFRKGGCMPHIFPDFGRLRMALQKRFGGSWKVLVRNHYFVSGTSDYADPYIINVSSYEDMQELILASDVMVSDFSSAMWDFSLTGRPCFAFAGDWDAYNESDRSFAVHPARWPYPVCHSMDGLCLAIMQFDNVKYQEAVKEHHRQMGSYENGSSCQKLAKRIKNLQAELRYGGARCSLKNSCSR